MKQTKELNQEKQWTLYSVVRFLKREWYKLAFYEGRDDNRIRGKFKVLYDDGRMSENMCWRVANDYAEMFKGKVLNSF
tara:strand:- start:10 stop:243 length:234 start_codon:yes stop_codon:yes gene_type:complete